MTDEKHELAVEIDTDKSAIEETVEKPKLAVEIDADKSPIEETYEKPKPAVEIDADKSVIEETDEKPKSIETPEPDMEDTNEEVLTQNVDPVASSPSKLAENRSSGLVSEESFEQLGTVEIVAAILQSKRLMKCLH